MPPCQKVVAIVDDDPDMLKGIVRLLRAYGFKTEAFTSAESFLDHAAASQAACLILDIHLGGISGIELHRRLTAAGSTLPIIFVTGMDEDGVRQEAETAGCIALLRKPFPGRHLMSAVSRATGVEL